MIHSLDSYKLQTLLLNIEFHFIGSLDGGPLSGLAASIEATCNSQLAAGGLLQGGGSGGGGGRAKRMRTSFKHHQLRTMKTYFSVNQNPDAKDLKQLAQKTGLSKRVLQVSVSSSVPHCLFLVGALPSDSYCFCHLSTFIVCSVYSFSKPFLLFLLLLLT